MVGKGSLSVEADEAVELLLNVFGILVNLLVRNHLSHFGLAGRVADSGSAVTNERDSDMPLLPQMTEREERNHVSDVKARPRRVTAHIKCDRAFVHEVRKSLLVRTLREKTALL